MNDKSNIEKRLASAIRETTPDILDELMKELDTDIVQEPALSEAIKREVPEVVEMKPRRKRSWHKAMASCAAALVLVIGGAIYIGTGNSTFAVVGLDVNPSVEISINKKEKVVSVDAVNEDGEQILNDMDLEGTDLDVACNALVGAMLTKGYLTDTSNGLLVSVMSDNEDKGKEIESRLSGNLNTYLEDSEVATAIIGQVVRDDADIEAFAHENNVSLGKAWLISTLVNTGDPKMTEDSLLKLSVKDLILLTQKKELSDVDSYGEADTSEYIGNEKALAAALEYAGLTESQVSNVHVSYECDDGAIVYDVEFNSGGQEYEFDVNAITGEIVVEEIDEQDSYDDDRDDDNDHDDDDDDDDHDDDDDDDDHDDDD